MPIELHGLALCTKCHHSDMRGCELVALELRTMVDRLNRLEKIAHVQLPPVRIVVETPCLDTLTWAAKPGKER